MVGGSGEYRCLESLKMSFFGIGNMTADLTLSASKIEEIVDDLSREIANRHRSTPNLFVAGIAEGGLGLSLRLAAKMEEEFSREIPTGSLNISFHRDDIGTNPIPRDCTPTQLPPEVESSTCILVDDVFFSGRTVRAALNELFDQGRPACVELAVLVDRGHRCLPLKPDYVGIELNTEVGQVVEAIVGEVSSEQDRVIVS